MAIMILGVAHKASAQGCGDGPSDEGINIFGFMQPQFEMVFEDETINSFTFERARIGIQGLIPYDFSYYVVVELSPFIDPSANPYLLDAFITYSRFDWARISVGSFKTPLGLETNTACNNLLTIYRSTATGQMVAPFRDMGAVVMGGNNNSKINYQLGLMNGRGLKSFDNNDKKDVVARLIYKPFDFMHIGGSFRYGYPVNNTENTRTTFGAEAKINYGNFTFMGEYLMDEGAYSTLSAGGCGGEPMILGEERSGGWFALAYMTQWNLQPVIKYDFFDSGNSQGYKESNLTFGLNYFLNDWTRLQANYIYRAEDPVELPNDMFVLQIQVIF